MRFLTALFLAACPACSFAMMAKVDNQSFRNDIINYVLEQTWKKPDAQTTEPLKTLDKQWNNFYQKTNWDICISLYRKGTLVKTSCHHGSHLTETLNKILSDMPPLKNSSDDRFKIDFHYFPSLTYSFIQYIQQGLELTGNRVAVRQVSKESLDVQIEASKQYLLRVLHPRWHGAFKFYHASEDKKAPLLRTIYTASVLYSLIKINQIKPDPALESLFKPIAQFLLNRQIIEGPEAGGFYYAWNPLTDKNTCRVVAGTASKTIFTLLELNRLYPNDPEYLQSAIAAGNWLLTRVESDGRVRAVADCSMGVWHDDPKQSFLYSGQVLSALSRLFAVTHDERYRAAALKIGSYFLKEIDTQGYFVGDQYRPPNSISTSWMWMSLMDLAKINDDPKWLNVTEKIAEVILARQITRLDDIFNNGRFLDAMTTSGNGWLNEVTGTWYPFCLQKKLKNCEASHQAMILSSRWLLQNAFTPQNSWNVKNPSAALGGFITHFNTWTVRTDAVCHGLNSLIELQQTLTADDSILLDIPERPLAEILPLLRAGT